MHIDQRNSKQSNEAAFRNWSPEELKLGIKRPRGIYQEQRGDNDEFESIELYWIITNSNGKRRKHAAQSDIAAAFAAKWRGKFK